MIDLKNLTPFQLDALKEIGNIGASHADTFHEDLHPGLRADFILANPPFNISNWGGERLSGDVRWRFGAPPAGNANYAWLQHIVHHLGPAGMAGVVLANGSMSSRQSGEGDIRRRLVEAAMVDCMVALPGQLFYATQIPCCLWLLARRKGEGRFRRRRGEVLFVDARRLGRMDTRVHRVLDPEDIARVAGAYHAWRSADGNYEDVAGFCRAVGKDEIERQGFLLTPGRYVGTEELEAAAEPFDEEMRRLTASLRADLIESRRLEADIAAALAALGFYA